MTDNPSGAPGRVGVTFLAHSANRMGCEDPLRDHLSAVAERAAGFARAFGAEGEAFLAGLLHDLGKYGDLFQKRLRGEEQLIDHWSPGAWVALQRYRELGIASALAVLGHHVGLQNAQSDHLRSIDPARWDPALHDGRRLSEVNSDVLLRRLEADGLALVAPQSSIYNHADKAVSAMLDVRMLFSTLVDADFIETEAFFGAIGSEKSYRVPGPVLDPQRALEVLSTHIASLARQSRAAKAVNRVRADVLDACLAAAARPQGQFTLTAPTGSGKTLSMLAFALKHAAIHNLRRVVVVIPYLSIIDQTAEQYRRILEPVFGPEYVCEQHSLAGTRGEDDVEDRDGDRRHELTENWDAPLVITTSVQMLESLFANRPSACRKLHRLARSVIIFDEVQTLPASLAVPTLAALSRLTERYGASVVFASATQPAFGHLDGHLKKWCSLGWQPTEIVPAQLKLFARLQRTEVEWPAPGMRLSWDELAERLASEDCRQALCVVNLKRQALLLFEKLRDRLGDDTGLFHLSTSMCPEHRRATLDGIRRRLEKENGAPCRLISTQCIEAGVDVDFPVAFRAWGPLESVAQVAGRCNRNGRRPVGRLRVFVPEDDAYPDGGYRRAAGVARLLAASRALNIDDPELYAEYYRQLYAIARPQNRSEDLLDAITRRDFIAVAKHYRLIPDATISVLVPYDQSVYDELAGLVRREGISRTWIRRARPHTISVYRGRRSAPIWDWLEPVRCGRDRESDEWFIYLRSDHYDAKVGLQPPESLDCVIG